MRVYFLLQKHLWSYLSPAYIESQKRDSEGSFLNKVTVMGFEGTAT